MSAEEDHKTQEPENIPSAGNSLQEPLKAGRAFCIEAPEIAEATGMEGEELLGQPVSRRK